MVKRIEQLNWGNYPYPEMFPYKLLKIFNEADERKICSSRNKSKKIEPSEVILKALYHMLQGAGDLFDDFYIKSAAVIEKNDLQEIIQIELKSKESQDYNIHYVEYEDRAYITHACFEHPNRSIHCYHTIMALAIVDIYKYPNGPFATAFNKLLNVWPNGEMKEIVESLALAQDELYWDFKEKRIPFEESELEIRSSNEPSEKPIRGIYPHIAGYKPEMCPENNMKKTLDALVDIHVSKYDIKSEFNPNTVRSVEDLFQNLI